MRRRLEGTNPGLDDQTGCPEPANCQVPTPAT